MPLPEDEQRQLRDIERAPYDNDPEFARRMRAGDPPMHYVRTLLRVLLGVVIGAWGREELLRRDGCPAPGDVRPLPASPSPGSLSGRRAVCSRPPGRVGT